MLSVYDLLDSFHIPDPPDIGDCHEALKQAFGRRQRQFEVVWYAAHGLDRKEIAEKMCIAMNTVDTHLKNARSSLRLTAAQTTRLMLGISGRWPPRHEQLRLI